MFVCQSGLQNPVCLDKRHLQETGSDTSPEQFANLRRQLAEAWVRIVVLVGSGIIEIAVGMKRCQLAQEFSQFQINIEWSKISRFNQRLEPGPETIEGPQAHHLFELDASHCVDAESSARNLEHQ